MTETKLLPIPNDLWGRIDSLHRFGVAHPRIPGQTEARKQLRRILITDRTADLPEALREFGRSRQRNINGEPIPLAKCHFARVASGLAVEVEQWIEDQRKVAA